MVYHIHVEALSAVIKMASCSSNSVFNESDSVDIENLIQPEGTFRVNVYGSFVAEGGEESMENGETEPTRALATQTVVSYKLSYYLLE